MHKKYLLKIVICVLIIVISLLLYTGFEKESFTGKDASGYNVGFALSLNTWRVAVAGIAVILVLFLLRKLLTSSKK